MHFSPINQSLFRYLNFTNRINGLARALLLSRRAGPSVAMLTLSGVLQDRVAGSLCGFQDKVLQQGLRYPTKFGFLIMCPDGALANETACHSNEKII